MIAWLYVPASNEPRATGLVNVFVYKVPTAKKVKDYTMTPQKLYGAIVSINVTAYLMTLLASGPKLLGRNDYLISFLKKEGIGIIKHSAQPQEQT